MPARESDERHCIACGYQLRGLEKPVCPECGRAFDPEDASTFDRSPHRRRRRRWVVVGCLIGGLAAAAYVFYPRSHTRYYITFTCQKCGAEVTVNRWCPDPPRWFPVRYPAWTWPIGDATPPAGAGCAQHRYDVTVGYKSSGGSGAFGKNSETAKKSVFVNKIQATPRNASRILKSMARRGGFLIGAREINPTTTPVSP